MSTLIKQKRLKTDYHHGNLINDLKNHAIKMIKSHGVNNFSLRNLAAKCGVSATSVYRHYESKEHLLVEIAIDGFQGLQEAMLASKEPNQFQNMGIAYIEFALKNSVKFQLMFSTFLEKDKYPLLLKKSIEAYQILREQVVDGVDKKIMSGNVDSLTRTAWATVHGTAMLLLDNQFVAQKDEKINSIQIALEVTTILGRGLFMKST